MNIHEIEKLGGIITLDELTSLYDSDISLVTDDLKEDLFQASFPLEQILDIGWYPEFCENGFFRVVLISNQNWASPTYSATAKNWNELETVIKFVLKMLKTT